MKNNRNTTLASRKATTALRNVEKPLEKAPIPRRKKKPEVCILFNFRMKINFLEEWNSRLY